MTAQRKDFCIYNGKEYEIIMETNPSSFNPKIFGLAPGRCSTAVARGYWVGFQIKENDLFIEQLNIFTNDNHYPSINGIFAINPGVTVLTNDLGNTFSFKNNMGCWIYNGLKHHHPYTGKFLLGKDPYNSDHGFHGCYWTFKNVISIEFKDGKVMAVEDYTDVSNQIRQMIHDNKDRKKSNDFFHLFHLQEMAELWLENPPWWIKNKVKDRKRSTE